jgi:signal transduction histidine kinase
VGTLVHDLRNPLTVVRAAVDLIEMEAPGVHGGAHGKELLAAARQASDRLLELVRALLDVHGLESRRMPLARARAELGSLVAEAVGMQGPLARARQLQLVTEVPADLPAVSVDAALISRVLQNLLGNAIKFTPAGGAVRVSARREGQEVAVSVSDDGAGVPPELLPRLFQAFAHGDHLERGSGLGLAFCRLAVEAHGGRIGVESEPGRGSTFTFTLPVA